VTRTIPAVVDFRHVCAYLDSGRGGWATPGHREEGKRDAYMQVIGA
jgi:hypothetical protein